MPLRSRRITAAVLLLLCRSAGAADPARIFVYAQRETPARSWIAVACDSEAVAEVKRGTFFALEVRPGRHACAVGEGVPVSIEVRPAEAVFIRLDWSYDLRRQPIAVLSAVPAERAQKEMRYLGYTARRRIHSQAVSAADPRPAVSPLLKTREPQQPAR